MDLHSTSFRAPVCDAPLPAAVTGPIAFSPAVPVGLPSVRKARHPHPNAEIRMAGRDRKEKALEDLEARITELWGHINAATARFLALLAEFDRKAGWAQHGVASCAHWLNWQCGVSPGAAREKVRVARALESLPKIMRAFSEGRLSYSKVRAVTRMASPETEDSLLNIALHGTAAHVERTVRGFRRVRRYLEREEAQALHERRYLDCRRESDGGVRLEAWLPPELGETLLKALDAAQSEIDEGDGDAKSAEERDADVPAGTRPEQSQGRQCCGAAPASVPAETPSCSAGQRRADALGHVLERFLSGKCSSSANGAHEVVVHIAHDALRDAPESGGASFEDGRSVAVETARRLGCDGALAGVVKGAKGEPLAVGRRTRAVPPAIRRALRIRDGGCRFPGCGRSRHVHGQRIRHWADGGETALDNLVTLCSQHHRLVHEGGYGVRVNKGRIEFLRPDGRAMPPAGMLGAFPRERLRGGGVGKPLQGGEALAALNAARGLEIDAKTARCRWGGERMDYDIAIDGLCWKAGYR